MSPSDAPATARSPKLPRATPRWRTWSAGFAQALVFIGLLGVLIPNSLQAQEIEPRRWSHLPTGVMFAGVGYRYGTGDITFDPTLEIEEAEFDQQDGVLSSVYSFAWWGKSMRIEALLPYGYSKWQGLLQGAPASTTREGMRDATFRLSMNLTGAPALSGREFGAWQAANPVRTSTGIGLQVSAPTGEYLEERLLNLGNNRWAIRPQAGILHTHNDWQFELTGTLAFYTDNDEFLVTRTQATDPLLFVQAHAIRTFRPGLWASLSWGGTWGQENQIDGIDRNDERGENFYAVSVGLPINRQQGVKLAWIGSRTHKASGFDSDNIVLAWSMMFDP